MLGVKVVWLFESTHLSSLGDYREELHVSDTQSEQTLKVFRCANVDQVKVGGMNGAQQSKCK